jgi:hypothetical protein
MRDLNLKIPDIKQVLSVTRLLGKLGISYCRQRQPQPPLPYTYSDKYPEFTYGWGLKQTKDYVEAKYQYTNSTNSPLDQLQKGNELHEIKRTRQLMSTLNKLGLITPDAGLQICRRFVTRMRRR